MTEITQSIIRIEFYGGFQMDSIDKTILPIYLPSNGDRTTKSSGRSR